MGDAEVTKSVKKTQEQLGRFVKKPPLTEKNLSRPPFRFLHDIVHNVIDTTGFLSGVFTPDELDASKITSRDAKSAFMQKLIQGIKDKTGEEVPLKVSKVLAGLEADKTNALLQALAKGIEVHQQGGGGGGSAGGKKGGNKAPASTPATGSASRSSSKDKADGKKGGKAGSGEKEKKEGQAGSKRGIRDRDPSPGQNKLAAKQGKLGEKGAEAAPAPGSGTKKSRSRTESKAAPPPQPIIPSEPAEQVPDETEIPTPKTSAPLERKESSADLGASGNAKSNVPEEMDLDNGGEEMMITASPGLDGSDNANINSVDTLELYDNFAASVVKPNMQTLPPPTTPIYSDADAVIATMASPGDIVPPKSQSPQTPIRSPLTIGGTTTPSPGQSLTPTPSPISQIAAAGGGGGGSGQRPQTGKSLSREPSAESKGSPYGSATIGEVRPPTGQSLRSRPDTGTAAGSSRMSSARPPSARRAPPPRPKSSAVKEEVEPYRPTTGKVAHVIMDTTEDPDDDDNYVVREVTVTASKAPGLSDLDETPELTLSGGIGTGEQLDSILPPDQRGLLVNQILETQKELEDKKRDVGGDTPMIEKKLKELSLAEVEKLKNLIQLCARSANPLAKLLDYMAEDVDSMQKEYNNFREESKRLSLELENSKTDTDKFLQSLKHELHDIERKVKDKEDAILASQMKIIQQEERIEEIVTGFERVRSGKNAAVEQHMPPADEILAHIQGQSSTASSGFGSASSFAFSPGSPPENNSSFRMRPSITPGGGGGMIGTPDSFKVPDSFMATNTGGGGGLGSPAGARGELSSPFSRGRMWSSTTNNNNNPSSGLVSFDRVNSEEDQQPSFGSAAGFNQTKNPGRSGANSFRRSTTSATDYQMETDVDNFNPWS